MAPEIEMNIEMNKANSQSHSQPKQARPAATLEEIVRLTGKDPLVAFAEAACGRLECTGCNGTGNIGSGDSQKTCKRCQGTKREKVSATAMLAARYKLATFFYAPRKAVDASGAEGPPPERFLTVRFSGRNGEKPPEPA